VLTLEAAVAVLVLTEKVQMAPAVEVVPLTDTVGLVGLLEAMLLLLLPQQLAKVFIALQFFPPPVLLVVVLRE